MKLSRQQIKTMATGIEEHLINVQYAPEEISKMKDDVIELQMKKFNEDIEWKDIKKEHNEKVGDMKKEIIETIGKIKNGFVQQVTNLYLIPNYDNFTMEYYKEDGDFIRARPMLPEERQLQLHQVKTVNE